MEALPEALARAEAHLPPEQRPLSLGWTRFLGVMGLCLDAAIKAPGIIAASAVARLFEEIHDDKLDFLTRKISRLPPARRPLHPTGGGSVEVVGAAADLIGMSAANGGGPGETCTESSMSQNRARSAPAGVSSQGMCTGGGSSAATLTEEGLSVETGDDVNDMSTAGGGGVTRARELGGGGKGDGAVCERERRGRGGSSSALKSLLRPQARHEVARGYGEAMSRRRERQRQALQRAPEPDLEPTRAYKSCGLCQVSFFPPVTVQTFGGGVSTGAFWSTVLCCSPREVAVRRAKERYQKHSDLWVPELAPFRVNIRVSQFCFKSYVLCAANQYARVQLIGTDG